MNQFSNKKEGMAAMAGCALLWSCGGLFIKMVDWHPLAISGARSLVAGIFIAAVSGRPRFTLSKAQILAAVFHCLTMILFVAATRMTTAANAIMLQYTAPVYVAILGWAVLGEKPRVHHWAALVAILGGLILFFKDEMGVGHGPGNLIALGSGVCFALFSLFMRLQKNDSPTESLLLSNALAFLIGIPFYSTLPLPSAAGWASIAALGIFQTGLSLVLFSYSIKRVSALSAMLIAVLEPLLNPVWVYMGTGERPGFWSLIGGLIILTAVTLSSILSVSGGRTASRVESVAESSRSRQPGHE